jgi:hypothetical protein
VSVDDDIAATFTSPDEALIVDRWVATLQHAYRLARGERWNQLKGVRASGFDARGVHLLSEAVGDLKACEQLAGLHLLEGVCVMPEVLRQAGREDAERDFRDRILKEAQAA